MRIKTIYLKGYRLLTLKDIESIEITITNKMVLVLGTNGSGKSAMLKEMNPFPSSESNYREGGIKKICLEHNDSEYEFISYLNPGSKHTFIKNGVVLHEKVNTSLQRDLIIREFGYTQIIHKILIGETLFTSMNPQARRDILTMISPVDLKYGIALHKLIKENLRDVNGAIKHLNTKRTDNKLKLENLNIPDNLETERTELESKLNKAVPFTTSKLPSLFNLFDEIESDYNKLISISQRASKYKTMHVEEKWITSIEDLNEYIGICAGNTTSTQNKINSLIKDINDIQNIVNPVTDGQIYVNDVETRLLELSKLIDNEDSSDYKPLVENNHDNYLNAFHILRNELENIYAGLPENCRFLNRIEKEEILNKQKALLLEINIGENKVMTLENKIEHFNKDQQSTICPRCSFVFSINRDNIDETIKTHENKLKDIKEELDNNRKTLEQINEKVLDVNNQNTISSVIVNLKRTLQLPLDFWDKFETVNDILNSRNNVIFYIHTWVTNINIGKKRKELEIEFNTCKQIKDMHGKYGSQLGVKLNALNNELDEEMDKLYLFKEKTGRAKQLLKSITYYKSLTNQADDVISGLNEKFILAINSAIQQDAKINCDIIYKKLADSHSLITKRNNLKNSSIEMSNEYDELVADQLCWSILEEQLSPIKGMIADQMLGFIQNFFGNMAMICQAVWSYKLEIKMCSMDDGVLSYYFPFTVNNENVPDISDGSKSQRDILNISFAIAMRKYLNMEMFPLYFDESDANFDDEHRARMLSFIKSLIETDQCSQVFMVNHYAIFDSLTNVDIIVLSTDNIVVPDEYNQNVKITYRGENERFSV